MNRVLLFLLLGAPALAADISGIWMMGQSLGDGSESLPVVSTEGSRWGNLMFERGVRTWLTKDNSATPEKRRFIRLISERDMVSPVGDGNSRIH